MGARKTNQGVQLYTLYEQISHSVCFVEMLSMSVGCKRVTGLVTFVSVERIFDSDFGCHDGFVLLRHSYYGYRNKVTYVLIC